ncbi:hypothetical protein CXQ81_27095 [Pseudomonas sp. 09C 129]|uniref:hypothetical protein n=1 Tax=Pseudomonas sp. 09C 129 TaxID=2054915 RepID=UPI000C6CB0B6|nr:hypothetical protein [Pseudomonas sp. 09C 129]AUG04126.1 hypothetical protein CXQ81_27095 [Pseudomonas sp. 09C 129]
MNFVKLQFSDGRPNVEGIESVNAILRSVGVRASTVAIPEEAKPILKASLARATTEKEQNKLLEIFSMNRENLLEQIQLAGRTPEVHRGGFLGTREGDTAPYPKIYDMKTLTPDMRTWALNRYGRMHVNTSDDGAGIDEVMTVVSGGAFTWMFVLPDGVLARLTVMEINPEGPAVRLSYPGIGMHAGYMEPMQGIIVAYAHGPESFTIRFEEASVPHSELLNTNLWVDFSGDVPKLFDKVS